MGQRGGIDQEKPVGASSDGGLGRKPTPRFRQTSKIPFPPQEKSPQDPSYGSSGDRTKGSSDECTKTKGKGGKKGMCKTPGNITPRKQMETPSASNYQGRNFDPIFVHS